MAALEKKDDEKDEAGEGNKESSGQNKKKPEETPEEEEDDKNNEETALLGASNKQDTKDTNRNDSARASKNESGRNGSGDGKSDCCDEVMRAISEVMETQDSGGLSLYFTHIKVYNFENITVTLLQTYALQCIQMQCMHYSTVTRLT